MAAIQSWPMCHSVLSHLSLSRSIKNYQKIKFWRLNHGVLTEVNFQKTTSFCSVNINKVKTLRTGDADLRS